jgi:hypothetical protein
VVSRLARKATCGAANTTRVRPSGGLIARPGSECLFRVVPAGVRLAARAITERERSTDHGTRSRGGGYC